MEIGSTYRTIEEYLDALEKRQNQEKAPTAAIFFLGAEEMMFQKFGGIPWLTRVRCELPTRPLGPSGEEEPVRGGGIVKSTCEMARETRDVRDVRERRKTRDISCAYFLYACHCCGHRMLSSDTSC